MLFTTIKVGKRNFIEKEDYFIIYKRDLKKLKKQFIYEIFCEFGFKMRKISFR